MSKITYLFIIFIVISGCKSQNISTSQPTPLTASIEKYESIYQELASEYPSIWPNFSEEKLKKEKEILQSLQTDIQKVAANSLSPADQINKDMLLFEIENRLFQITFGSHLFPLNAEGGFITSIVHNIRGQQIKNDDDFELYKKRLIAIRPYFEHRIELMKEGQKAGKSSPKLVVNNCIQLLEEVLHTAPKNSFFTIPVANNKKYKEATEVLVKHQVLPAYQLLHDYLKAEYLVHAPTDIGISGITGGESFYEQRVHYFTSFDISPKEVFDIGQQEVKRIRKEMEAIIQSLNFEGSFSDFLAFLRTDPQFYPATDMELLKEAAWITKEMEGKLPQYFGRLPRMPLTVKPVPAAIAPHYTVGRYSRGSYTNHKAGEYWVNTYKLDSRALYVLPALSLHEGVPGHHLQIMLAAEMDNLPQFRQSSYISAFGEGWGLYAEYLGNEAGIYKTPYEQFGRLTYEMWRACRLVVDPGMHYMGWTREEAVEFMATNTALSLHEVNTEINRYIGWPGQAVSYKMGELKIKELRTKAEKALGDQFDIRIFHDKILENGSIPLATLERVIDHYISTEKSKTNE